MDTYDEIPYDSTPFQETHPNELGVRGILFGLDTAPAASCRYLELGCASGGNLIPLAYYQPDSEFIGIDLSARQVEAGQSFIEMLGLRNVTLRVADIQNIGEEFGHFDYIVAHGVYSWIPLTVREKVLALCARLLNPAGVAYLSYNTLPGWRMRGMLRDMLLYATRGQATPAARLKNAQSFLATLDDLLSGNDTPRARYLGGEIASLKKSHPAYLYHEYLEETNEPVLFSEFLSQAQRHGLAYLCESELYTNFPDTFPERIAEFLGQFDEPADREQYTDFLHNRTFRQSLLCRTDGGAKAEIQLDALDTLALRAALEPVQPSELRRPKRQRFRAQDGSLVDLTHPLTKAALLIAAKSRPNTLSLHALNAEAHRKLLAQGASPEVAAQDDHFYGEIFTLFVNGAVGLSPYASELSLPKVDKPRANQLTRALVDKHAGYAVTPHHLMVRLDPFAIRVLALTDGARDLEAMSTQLAQEIERGDLVIPRLKRKPGRLARDLRNNLERLVTQFARDGLLEN